ncbi:MAG: helicase-exonuclease AddAB subunit AddA [Ruminococcaceae bacterium]|nr:helicase-exonuclease AddAB subunit AddA [Oscillospiraceae bacterium]
MNNWTKEQQQAIYQRDGSLLVSAAAGSGKTAVLTNRVVEYAAAGGSLDRLLVVTFTRLAASEMRERIGKLLPTADFKDSESLRRQKLLLYKAKICTIDSFFCEIVRENFKTLGISPDFRLLDEAEYLFLKTEVLTDLLEERYADFSNGFDELLRLFGGEGENEALSEQINLLYTFFQALPFPEDWADGQKAAYLDPNIWLSDACEEILPDIKDYIGIYEDIINDCPFSDKGMDIVSSEAEFLKSIKTALENGDWNSVHKLVSGYSFPTSPKCKPYTRATLKFETFRAELKDYLKKPIFTMSSEILKSDLEQVRGGVFALIDITLEYISRVNAEMKRKNAYSFDAIAHFALGLTVKRDENGIAEKTEYAKELSEMFDEILIDEYQDVNDLQECFFSSISKNNCFAVGDVKQSIYMFRQANPDNFIAKEGLFPVIYLNKNFRSRKGILDFCNFVFEHLFSSRAGGMDYGENEALYYGAKYPERDGADVEIHLLKGEDDEENVETQARFAARKIKQLINDGLKVSDPARPADFSDFAVIMRTMTNAAVYERIFFEEGVPCCGTGGGTFLDSPEISTVFAFMKAIDNPYDDLSLFAAMFSPIGGFSADEIAKIKLEDKKAPLYSSLVRSSEENEHSAEFLDMLTKMQILARNFPVHRLLWQIYETTGYPSYVSCMPLGYLKKERLMSFYAFCRSFGENKGGTLYEFIKFTENASASGNIKAPESTPSGNFVKIMTIHASKGLEFPIVILPQINQQFNMKDLSKPLILDISAGIATKMRDPAMVYEQTTFMYELVSRKKRRKLMSENLRLLYVAFTRARENLIIISCSKKYDEVKLQKKSVFRENGKVYQSQIIDARSPEDLLLYCLTCHPKCEPLITEFSDVETKEREDIFVQADEEMPDAFSVETEDRKTDIPISEQELKRRCISVEKKQRIPAKLSVTELVKNKLADERSEQFIKEQPEEETEMRRPRFMLDSEELSGAEAGTAIHTFISVANLDEPTEKEALRLVSKKILSERQAETVIKSKRKIEAFKSSDLYRKISSSKKVRKEEYFVARIPSSEFTSDTETKEEILLQGAIDLLCETEDGLLLLDYKTDRADEDELIRRYEKQLEYYVYAAEKCFNKPVNEVYIWSFYLSRQIRVYIKGEIK